MADAPMDPQRWERIKAIFQQAVERPKAERQAYVERACGDDEEVLREVLSLLETDLEGTEFLEISREPPPPRTAESDRLPSFGDSRYRVLQKIGEGGMGEVYEAEQLEPVRRRVALKVIKRGMDTREVIARFETERQALALMSHRSIARVFDAGSTVQGRPYFAMEFVEGVPITDYCDRHRLVPRERIELFREVCSAVQHAHQKGVIHRDLKPSNILVKVEGGAAVPKVIDFGVSKAIAQRLTERTLFTQLGHWVGTPEYMSPEQADLSGLDVDTRTDVYALGIVLYELLVGAKPFDPESLRSAGFDEIRRVIREEDPPKPSTRVSTLGNASNAAARNRNVDTATLRRSLQGDLDAIAMKALEKDRTRRYDSPNHLADDLARYLDDQPILASPPSAAYRARKFVRRHKLGVAAAAVALTAILAGSVMAFWQARIATRERDKAEKRFQDVRKLANTLIFDVYDEIDELAGSTPARELVVREALVYLDALAGEADDDLALRHELALAYMRIGDVQGYVYRSNLGDLTGADRSYQRALELFRELPGLSHPDPALLVRLGYLHIRRGVISSELADVDSVLEHYQTALDVTEPLLETYPDRSDVKRVVVLANEAIGIALEEQARFDAALVLYRRNLEIELEILEQRPASTEARQDVVGSRARIGQSFQGLRRWSEAAGQMRTAMELMTELVAEDPDNASHRRIRAFIVRELGRCYGQMGRFEEAHELFETAWVELRELSRLDPDDVLLRGDLGVIAAQRARALYLEGRNASALEWFEVAIGYGRALPLEYRESYDVAIYLIRVHLHHSEALIAAGRGEEALAELRDAVRLGEDIRAMDPKRALGWEDLTVAYLRLAELLVEGPTEPASCAEARHVFDRGAAGRDYLAERGAPTGWPTASELSSIKADVAACT